MLHLLGDDAQSVGQHLAPNVAILVHEPIFTHSRGRRCTTCKYHKNNDLCSKHCALTRISSKIGFPGGKYLPA
jgi:hypothetical protein